MSYSIRPTQILHLVQYSDQVTGWSPENSVRFLGWAKRFQIETRSLLRLLSSGHPGDL